ncbi:MAG TPA: hypothetical protein VNO79_11155 [Actinomycetota bacterium]|nr:hypothetical protein [Actinomycetota bacterium]
MGEEWRYRIGSLLTFLGFVLFWAAVLVVGYYLFAGSPDPCADAVGGQCIP